MGVVSLFLSCHDASTDMEHDLFGSPRDLDLSSNVDITFQGHHTGYADSFLIPKVIRKNHYCQK